MVEAARGVGDSGELIEVVADAAQRGDGSRIDPSGKAATQSRLAEVGAGW